ncbi:hypothetical protein [Bacillus aerolatus]|uniref:hypothetical protein n=1 Tax=Bacillus aerolatus TaxID=2653354 RepID=UPI0017831ADF|nr:hypothetical protein [Bacillus aerolatus]
MSAKKIEDVLKNLTPKEFQVLEKILDAEKEMLHKKSLKGTQIRKDVYNIIKSGVEE